MKINWINVEDRMPQVSLSCIHVLGYQSQDVLLKIKKATGGIPNPFPQDGNIIQGCRSMLVEKRELGWFDFRGNFIPDDEVTSWAEINNN